MLGDIQAAEDATQETFLSAWQGIQKFRGGSFQTWLYHIAANACRDELRRLKRHPTTPLEDLLLESPELSTPTTPEDYALQQELSQQVQKALNTLPPELRLAIVLRDLQGLSYEDVAQAMNCSLGTVRSRISRGREQLREHLSHLQSP